MIISNNFKMMPLHAYKSNTVNERGVDRADGNDFYQISCTLSGQGEFFDSENNRHVLNRGDILYIPPQKRHKYHSVGAEPWSHSYITIGGLSVMDGLFDSLGYPSNACIIKSEELNNDNIIDLFIQTTEKYAEHTDFTNLIMHSILFRIVLECSKAFSISSEKKDFKSLLTANAINYIEKNFTAELTVADIVEKLKTTEYSLYAAFKNDLGITPGDYMNMFKLEQAKKLLASQTDLSIREIGHLVGIWNSSVFNSKFKKAFNMTPGQYRKSMPKNDVKHNKYKNSSQSSLPVYVTDAGDCCNQHKLEWENFREGSMWRILLCTGGTANMTDKNDETHFIRPGNICILSPYENCVLTPLEKSWGFSWVQFDGKHLNRLMSILELNKTMVIHSESQLTIKYTYCKDSEYDFSKSMDNIYLKFYQNNDNTALNSSLMYELLIYASIASNGAHEIRSDAQKITPVIDIINMYYEKKLCLDELSHAIGVSTNTLISLFKTVYKKTPKEYITDVRISHAKRLLLKHSNMSVKDIASATGFSSPSHFVTVFKSAQHMTPDEFRNVYY